MGLIVACRLFAEGAGPFVLCLLRLIAICSIVSIFILLMPMWGCYALLVVGAITSGLVAIFFEMDLRAGLVVALVTWLGWVAVYIFFGTILT